LIHGSHSPITSSQKTFRNVLSSSIKNATTIIALFTLPNSFDNLSVIDMNRKYLSVSSKHAVEAVLILSVLLLFSLGGNHVVIENSEAFSVIPRTTCKWRTSTKHPSLLSPLGTSKIRDATSASSTDNDDSTRLCHEDKELLSETTKSQLVHLCRQFHLPSTGTKEEMLLRLRDYADTKREEERIRIERRKKQIEEGSPDDREKHEIVNTNGACM
jgi:hypothetical protein